MQNIRANLIVPILYEASDVLIAKILGDQNLNLNVSLRLAFFNLAKEIQMSNIKVLMISITE